MKIRTSIAVLGLAAVVTVAVGCRAEAQIFRGGPVLGTRTFVGPGGPVSLTPGVGTGTYTTVYGSSYSGGISGYVPPYSYYAAIPPAPARIYVDYAESGFNYYGRPYGHPNDRWSWEAMSVGGGLLNRYYYPPVR